MYDSGYRPPETPPGWTIGIFWIVGGMTLGLLWVVFVMAHIIDQKISNKPRWSTTKILSTSLVLIGAASFAIVGTFLTWKHPYRLGPCDCLENEWGPRCDPCQCNEHGVCDSGTYGSGLCSCDFGWAGLQCERCDDRWKPEAVGDETACDTCKTGYTGEKCEFCARGYTGDECDVCDDGWYPWQHTSELYPNAISDDDNRHLCDECLPNHWGYYCQQCPWGNDVPQVTLDRNVQLRNGSRVITTLGKSGFLTRMQIKQNSKWIESFDYDTTNPLILSKTRIKIKLDSDKSRTDWTLLKDIRGAQCNNRGKCEDDETHQILNPNWDKTCTWDSYQACTSNEDCTVSENCKGKCRGTELPLNALWVLKMDGKLCLTDDDCLDETILINELNETYTGGRCVSRGCCTESYHGNGKCDCDPKYFGPIEDDGFQPHYKKSPACDFCPGYDWLTEEPSTICSGGKGTCTPSYGRTGDYLQMRCTCGEETYIDKETGIADPNKIIAWSGNLCQCGDWNDDQRCDTCASGHWGPTCTQCPGGFGLRTCSGHGICQGSGSNAGTGKCVCDIKRQTAWMLAEYVKRYSTEYVGTNVDGNTLTCSECAPNFWGNQCLRCDQTYMIKPSELSDIFQPSGSYHLGIGQSSANPIPVCHPQKPWICSLACGGGGWCNWGRQGDGKCMCWSNKRANNATWNPLDNVCIGKNRFDPNRNQTFDGTSEQCPSFGYCSEGDTSRTTQDVCGTETFIGFNKDMSIPIKSYNTVNWTPYDDWSNSSSNYNSECNGKGDQCYKWLTIDWRPRNWGFSCIKEGN
jgi:hypothetical protein